MALNPDLDREHIRALYGAQRFVHYPESDSDESKARESSKPQKSGLDRRRALYGAQRFVRDADQTSRTSNVTQDRNRALYGAHRFVHDPPSNESSRAASPDRSHDRAVYGAQRFVGDTDESSRATNSTQDRNRALHGVQRSVRDQDPEVSNAQQPSKAAQSDLDRIRALYGAQRFVHDPPSNTPSRVPSPDHSHDRALYGAQRFIRDTDSATPDRKEPLTDSHIPEESSIQSPAVSSHPSVDHGGPSSSWQTLDFVWAFTMRCVYECTKTFVALVILMAASSFISSMVPLLGTTDCAKIQPVVAAVKSIWETIPLATTLSISRTSAVSDPGNSIKLNLTQIPASVMHEGTSPTHRPRFDVKLMLRLWGKTARTADMVLSGDISPGACWPMRGSSGHITLRLQDPSMVRSVTLAHGIQFSETAPNLVLLWAVLPDNHNLTENIYDSNISQVSGQYASLTQRLRPILDDGYILYPAGEIQYDTRATSRTQSFSLYPSFLELDVPTSAFVVHVVNNWGNQEYTCLYNIGIYTESN